MAVTQAIDFAAETRKMFKLFDQMKVDELRALFATDVQGVDEISRKWMRGGKAIDNYFAQLEKMNVEEMRSRLSDLHSEKWGDVAVVTGMADQTYSVEGTPMTIKAPITVLYRRVKDGWKIALIHAVSLPEAG